MWDHAAGVICVVEAGGQVDFLFKSSAFYCAFTPYCITFQLSSSQIVAWKSDCNRRIQEIGGALLTPSCSAFFSNIYITICLQLYEYWLPYDPFDFHNFAKWEIQVSDLEGTALENLIGNGRETFTVKGGGILASNSALHRLLLTRVRKQASNFGT